jgi:hypothetical protein
VITHHTLLVPEPAERNNYEILGKYDDILAPGRQRSFNQVVVNAAACVDGDFAVEQLTEI